MLLAPLAACGGDNAEETGEIVNDALFARNQMIDALLNVKLTLHWPETTSQKTSNHVIDSITAGEELYDLCSLVQWIFIKKGTQDYFVNLADMENVDWDKPWWNTENMGEHRWAATSCFSYRGISPSCG